MLRLLILLECDKCRASLPYVALLMANRDPCEWGMEAESIYLSAWEGGWYPNPKTGEWTCNQCQLKNTTAMEVSRKP